MEILLIGHALDKLDDLTECNSKDGKTFGKNIFVSCWTDDSKENIPLWKMYAGLDGVRLRFPSKWYKEYSLNENKKMNRIEANRMYLEFSSPYSGPISPEKLINKKYVISPLFKPEEFLVKVGYDDAKTLPNVIKEAKDKTTILMDTLGKYKSSYWEFQNEYRYLMYIHPHKEEQVTGSSSLKEKFPLINVPSDHISDFFIDISPSVFNSLEVVLGPKCFEEKRILVSALLEKYAPNAEIRKSILSGKIA